MSVLKFYTFYCDVTEEKVSKATGLLYWDVCVETVDTGCTNPRRRLEVRQGGRVAPRLGRPGLLSLPPLLTYKRSSA